MDLQKDLVLGVARYAVDDQPAVIGQRCKHPRISRTPLCCINAVFVLFVATEDTIRQRLLLAAAVRKPKSKQHKKPCMNIGEASTSKGAQIDT